MAVIKKQKTWKKGKKGFSKTETVSNTAKMSSRQQIRLAKIQSNAAAKTALAQGAGKTARTATRASAFSEVGKAAFDDENASTKNSGAAAMSALTGMINPGASDSVANATGPASNGNVSDGTSLNDIYS